MLLLIDNYDSFTYNLCQYFAELGQAVVVIRNDEKTVDEIEAMEPDRIVVSPGPSTPERAGRCNEVIRRFGPHLPVLGVCLGHQCIGYSYGGNVHRAPEILHGKSSPVYHDGAAVFSGLPSPFSVVRYHSLIVERDGLPDCLEVTAWTADGLIMGMRHREYPVQGVQFHPESFMTEYGKELLRNFLEGAVR
ncbi:MAG: aminodeoxychorismate/anthranilate synthase component II [Dehalococcoidia bacterium]|nr:aminodeoxychorismate/anthranilate synthase component II [Dehalococcoidia bacterium]